MAIDVEPVRDRLRRELAECVEQRRVARCSGNIVETAWLSDYILALRALLADPLALECIASWERPIK